MGAIMETRDALRVFGIAGLASILVDLDHPITILLIRPLDPAFEDCRFLHPSFFIVAGLLTGYFIAYCGRFYAKHLLERQK